MSTFLTTLVFLFSFLVLLATNPIHSLFCLVLVFLSAAGLLALYGFNFIGLLLVLVYVGALAVLFLFILLMVDIKISDKSSNGLEDWFVFSIVGFFIICFFSFQIYYYDFQFFVNAVLPIISPSIDLWVISITEINNCSTFGHILFSYYSFFVLLAGLVLLLALISTVRLALVHLVRRSV